MTAPEYWDAVCFDGVWAKLCKGFPSTIHPLTKALHKLSLERIQDDYDAAPLYEALRDWAYKEIEEAQQDFEGGLIDAAYEKHGRGLVTEGHDG